MNKARTHRLLDPIGRLDKSRLVPARSEQPELLDLGHGSRRDVAANLAEMQRLNRVLGGTRALTHHLYPRLLALRRPATVLDLGTGSAALPADIVAWGDGHGLRLHVLAVDWATRNLEIAAAETAGVPRLRLLLADAARPPLRAGSADYVISSLLMHHLSPRQLVALLRAAFDLAAGGLLMSDLVRGWLPYAGFRLVQPLLARHYLTRHDGALSILRAYTPRELLALARRAGLPGPRVVTHWPWRMTLIVDKRP